MRLITFITLLIMFNNPIFSQKVEYDIPEEYRKDIESKDYTKIVDLSIAVVQKRYKIESVKDGAIILGKDQDLKTLNIHNLIGKCLRVKNKKEWDNVIQEHYQNIFASIDEQKKINPTDYNTIQKYLTLRVYPKKFIEQRGGIEPIVTKPDIFETSTVLMLDLPGAFSSVQRELFKLWKKDEKEVFEDAQKNVNKQKVVQFAKKFKVNDKAEVEVTFIENEDYAASYVLDLENNLPNLVGKWGAAVAIPNKGIAVICKIDQENPVDFVNFIQLDKTTNEKFYREHPQPVSDRFFWYYKGKFTPINVQTDTKGNIIVIAPIELSLLMAEKK
jgi:hypothetical protein